MARLIRTVLLKKIHVPGLFQAALVGTGFVTLRLLQSPSTVTFFIFEVALAITLGIFLSGRLGYANHRPASGLREPSGAVDDADTPLALSRLRILAARLDIDPKGETGELQNRIKSELPSKPGKSVRVKPGRDLGSLFVEHIAPRTYLPQVTRAPSAATRYVSSLADEGSHLLLLAQDLDSSAKSYKRVLRQARTAARTGRLVHAITLLENGNQELRDRLSGVIDRDLRGSYRGSSRPYLVLSSAFFLLTALALWALSTGTYVAPLAFYVVVACATGALALNAQLSGSRRPLGVLLQITILAALLKFYFFYLNPYLYTSDTFFHYQGLLGIATTGHVPGDLVHYSYFPGYYGFGFAGVSVGGLPLAWYGIFAFIAQLVAIPAAYLIGREIANSRVGLFAAMLTLFSVFFFLPTIPLPSLFGFVFLFMAIYALIRVRGPGWQGWFAIFWISALGAFFSHAVTALVLLLVLLLRFVHFHVLDRKAVEARPSTTPVLSYGVVYAGYMAFIAFVSFELFVRTIFAPTQVPALATAPTETLRTTGSYLLQSAIAPLSVAILFFFAAFGMVALRGISTSERRFLVLLGFVFVLIPAIEVVAQNFAAQSTRFLSYLTIPFVLIGAHGAASASRLIRTRRRAATILVTVFTIFAFVGASSYLTNNDVRYLYDAIPTIPTHITESALSSRTFLGLADEGTLVYMDFGSWLYFNENAQRARNALELQTGTLDGFNGTVRSFVVLNAHFIPYGNPYVGIIYDSSRTLALLESARASRLFDAGEVQVYLTP